MISSRLPSSKFCANLEMCNARCRRAQKLHFNIQKLDSRIESRCISAGKFDTDVARGRTTKSSIVLWAYGFEFIVRREHPGNESIRWCIQKTSRSRAASYVFPVACTHRPHRGTRCKVAPWPNPHAHDNEGNIADKITRLGSEVHASQIVTV